MNVLFVCKYNRFRSKLAEAFFNQLSRKHFAKSAGMLKGAPIDDAIRNCAHQNNIEIVGVPKRISAAQLKWADMIIIVADDINPSLLTKKFSSQRKVIKQWAIPDTSNKKHTEMNKIAKLIKKRVLRLIVEIEK